MERWTKPREAVSAFLFELPIFKHADGKRVSIVWEGVDLDKMKAMLSGPEGLAAEAEDTVIHPSKSTSRSVGAIEGPRHRRRLLVRGWRDRLDVSRVD